MVNIAFHSSLEGLMERIVIEVKDHDPIGTDSSA
jgi:hypothetical protein